MLPLRRRLASSALPVLATLVEVSPTEFLGSVPCVDARGAMRRYVATVFDAGPEDVNGAGGANGGGDSSDFALPSSTVAHGDVTGDGAPDATPIPCAQTVGFSRVVIGNRYWAEIDGYDRDDLVALAPGTRILYDPVTSERVAPRWSTSCAKDQPVTAFSGIVRTIGCLLYTSPSPRD